LLTAKDHDAVICLACAGKHPHFKPLTHPAPMRKMRCQLCRGEEWCVANHEVGLPEQFLTVDEAFKLIASYIEQPKDSS
jgi:hypothetical protein